MESKQLGNTDSCLDVHIVASDFVHAEGGRGRAARLAGGGAARGSPRRGAGEGRRAARRRRGGEGQAAGCRAPIKLRAHGRSTRRHDVPRRRPSSLNSDGASGPPPPPSLSNPAPHPPPWCGRGELAAGLTAAPPAPALPAQGQSGGRDTRPGGGSLELAAEARRGVREAHA